MSALLFYGGRVHVGDGTSADALLAVDGRVAAVGQLADLRRRSGGAEPVDLAGGLMTAGWIDTHVHFMWWALQMDRLDLREAQTVEGALTTIAAHAGRLAPGAWLVGGRFDKNRWGRWPTAAELDRVTPGRPASLSSRDGHSRWLNTAALRAAEIAATTATPAGGAIDRDAHGAPTGILRESANRLIDAVVPPPSEAECLAAIARGQGEAHRRGIVGLEDLEGPDALAAFTSQNESGELALRVAMGIPYDGLDAAIARGVRTGAGDAWLRVGHLKIFTDGALGSQTAALEEPYAGSADRGLLTIEPAVLATAVARAAAAKIAVAIHAIGDRAVRIALDAIAPTRATHPALRQRVEHVQLVGEADIARFGTLGVIASMQPIHATSDRDLVDRHWGAERARRAYPWRSLAQAGAILAFGSDAPVEPIDPLTGIYAAVARRRPGDADRWQPQEALTLDAALAGYTTGAAYATGRERESGTLLPGMRADATVIDCDLAALPPEEWLGATVRATVVGGVIRHAAGLR